MLNSRKLAELIVEKYESDLTNKDWQEHMIDVWVQIINADDAGKEERNRNE